MSATDYGIGIYTAPEAARMVGMNANTLKRWLLGYDHDGKQEAELWKPQYVAGDDGLLLGFRDLVEARIVYALRQKGIGLQTIRICIERARTIVEDDRPFSTSQFKTDGKNIFLEIAKELAEPELIDLRKRQGVFRHVVEPSLQGLDFGESGAERWWLLPGKKTVVADPHRAFGQPIIAETGMTTARAAQIVKAEGSIERAAKVYEMPVRLLRDALAYQQHLGVRKAA
jgi:uncharacterized protein (DUF433 family)